MHPRPDAHRGFLSGLQAGKLFSDPGKAEERVVSGLKRAGYLFVATLEEATALDLLSGPKHPIRLSETRSSPAPVSKNEIPHLYEPSFFDLVVSAILGEQERQGMEIVRQTGEVILYRFPAAATSVLAELTPQRPDFAMATISGITDQLMTRDDVKTKFKRSGVQSAVLILRGYALKASPRSEGKELYYWFWRSP